MLGLILLPNLIFMGLTGLFLTGLPGIILFSTWRTVSRVIKAVLFIVLGVGALILLCLLLVFVLVLFGIALL